MSEIRNEIVGKWIAKMREYLSKHQIDHQFVSDDEIEDFFNLYLSFK